MPSQSLRRLLLLSLLSASLGGCGFRLAGTSPLPESLGSIYLATSELDNRQRDALLRRLERAGAEVSLEPGAGRVKLSVSLQPLSDRRMVTSASSGKTVDRLTRRLDYSVRSADGQLLAPARSLTQQRDITLDDDNLLSSSQEKDAVVEEMEQALYDQLIRQLGSI